MKVNQLLIILLASANFTFGQKIADVEQNYGKPTMAYSVSEHIWMTPEYDLNGQVCQMRLYPKRIAPNIDYLSKHLPFEQLQAFLNQLLPPLSRGMKKDSFGLTTTGGGAAWTSYPYEKITVTFIFALRVDSRDLKPIKPYSFSIKEHLPALNPEKTPPSSDDFLPSQATNTEIVRVEWNDRRCAAK